MGVRPHEAHGTGSLSGTDKLNAINLLALQWAAHLSSAECKLMLWLFGNTVMRGKRSGTYSVSQIVRGVRRADGSGYWCLGTGLSESTVHRSVNSLRSKGVVFTRSGERGISFVINLRWSGGSHDHEAIGSAAKRDAKAHDIADENGYAGAEFATGCTPEGALMANLKLPKKGISTPKGGVKMTEGGCQNDTLSKGKLQRVYQERTTTASGDAGVVSAGEKIQGIFSRVKAIHSTRREEAPNNAFGYKQTWDQSFSEFHPGIPVGWSIKDAGMIKRALANWPERLGSAHAFIGWSVEHWKEVVRAKFGWMTKNPAPGTPVPSFFAHYIRAFMDAWCDAETLRWAGTLPGTQARYQQLRQQGMSHDAATLEVAKEQAMTVDRQKRAADLRAAKRTLQLAQEVQKRTGATRFTAENPHPRARENRPVPVSAPTGDGDGSFEAAPLPRFNFDD